MKILGRKRNVVWMIPSSSKNPDRQLASVWIRCLQIIPYLANMGLTCSVNRTFPSPDVAIFLRRYSDEDVRLASRLKQKGTRIILDVVVNYFEVYPPHPLGYGGCLKEQNYNFMKLVELADEIWCVSPFLKSLAEKYHPCTVFVSDSIDETHFSYRKKFTGLISRPLRLGWAGVSVKAHVLNMFKPWVDEGGVALCVISDKPPGLDVPYEFRKWAFKAFPADIVDCDLCVAPRDVRDNYDRGHSLFKIGVFMSEGVPALAGDVPAYELILGERRGGHICRGQEEWKMCLRKYSSDNQALQKMSEEAIKELEPYLTVNVSKQVMERIRISQRR